MSRQEFTRKFGDLSKKDTAIAGGKGASLGEMTHLFGGQAPAYIPVPPGFVVLASAFDRFLKETDLAQEITAQLKRVNYEEVSSVDEASNVIRDLIHDAEMPKDLQKEFMDAYLTLYPSPARRGGFVAVRSSATAEDSSVASWAGELESYLNTDKNNLLANIKNCWSSLFTPRAIFYRKEKKLLETQVSVAVVVQKMIQSDVSGICFSVHPVTEDPNQMIIEAGWGLGEAIVGGLITPDSYVLDKKESKIIDKNISRQGMMIVREKNETKEVAVTASKQEKQKLSDKEILELSKICQEIENHYGFPCDIEWAYEKKKFYIVQSRPITTLMLNNKTNDSKEDFDERETVVVHRSELLTQDLVLKGIFQNTKFKQIGTTFNFPLIRYENGTGDISYPKNQLEEIRDIDLDKKDFEKLTTCLLKEISKYKEFLKEFQKDIESDDEKEKKIITFFDWTLKSAGLIPYFAFESNLAKLLEKEGIKQNEIPSTATYASRSTEELKKIAYEHRRELKKKKGKIPNNLKKDLENFCEKFGYLGMKYFGGRPWSVKEVFDFLWDVKDQELLCKKENFHKSLSPYIKIASDLLYARTQNWESLCFGCYLFRKFVKQYFSKKIKYEDAINLRIDDLLEILCGNAKLKEKNIYNKKFVLEIKKDGVYISNKGATKKEKIEHKGKELMGISAQIGKVTGKAKVIFTTKECGKVKKGDVLVTTMSTPDFLPAMNRAAAFVTDIGGITSHAAIVAREMKKPCIIGTKIATQVLKDGDEVEVDAEKGVVRILKRAK